MGSVNTRDNFFLHPIRAAFLPTAAALTCVLLPSLLAGSLRPVAEPTTVTVADTTDVVAPDKPGDGKFDPEEFFKGGEAAGPRDTVVSPARPDTGYVVVLDSTARLAHFKYVRRQSPYVPYFARRTHPLFAQSKPGSFKREVVVDSLGGAVHFRETIGGVDVRIPRSLPLTEYIAARRKHHLRTLLAEEARRAATVATRDDLGDIIGSITQIQIPIPPNPIFSIFGKPEIKLNISGAVDIKAGFRNTTSDQATISSFDQTRNEPDFSQDVQVNVTGTIGDKLNILADWNTQRTFEYENQLKINYTGYEDEIVQSVEAGNVSLSTPSSFVGSSQALFGVKARFQTGPLMLTTLASQKKGQIKEVSVSGGAQEIPFELQTWNYSTDHYFIDTAYIDFYESFYASDGFITAAQESLQIVEEEVWVFRLQAGVPDHRERQVIAYIDLPPRPPGGYPDTVKNFTGEAAGRIERGPFVPLERHQYNLNRQTGVLTLNTSVGDNQAVGIAYRTLSGRQVGERIRDVAQDERIVLKLVKPKGLLNRPPGYEIAWRMMLKNIYYLQSRNLRSEGFQLDIYRRIESGTDENSIFDQRLLRVLGVDRFSGDQLSETGDGVFDFRPRFTIDPTRGEIIFPRLRPFHTGILDYFTQIGQPLTDSSYVYPEIYDQPRVTAQQSIRNKYFIRGKATGDATSKYNLGFNVVEGSVQVLLNGQPLTPHIDYSVDYIIGEVIIRNNAALVPGANIQIKYEQNDLFQLASKTLLGARGDLALSKKTNLGFTIMNLNQQTLSDKVRLGEEPTNNTILGVDGATSMDLPFLTSAINSLPLLQTRELSTLRLSGEMAYMMPDPNTKKSPIPSDNGLGIAYIDDFEGARRTIPVGITFTQWMQPSPPADGGLFTPDVHDTLKMWSKGRTIWFNRLPTDVRLTDVYPDKRPGNPANDQITVMDVWYSPFTRGMYNHGPNVEALLPSKNWGGLMKVLSIVPINLTTENVNFIEIWMRVDRGLGDTLIVDLGAISEEAIPNDSLNTEDLVLNRNGTINRTLQEGEDVGLDMYDDAEERRRYGQVPGIDPNDPSGDNYSFDNTKVNTPEEDFSRINGTEGNRQGPGGLIPDTEDLNLNGVLDKLNAYFQYEIPLDTSSQSNPYVVGGGNAGWYQYRIPVRDFKRKIGPAILESIEFLRMSFRNAQDSIRIRIADFALVGNQWQDIRRGDTAFARLGDTTFSISVVSLEETPGYIVPPGVIRERDKTRPDEEVYANEQSMSLQFRGLPAKQSRQAVRYYTFRPLDLFNYRTMKMFVHGDASWSPDGSDAEVFLRFGSDTLNFYEYRAPVYPGWDPPRNEIVINFSDLTAIKQARDSINVLSPPIPVPGGPAGAAYRVRGNPSLTRIIYVGIGVTRPHSVRDRLRPGSPLYGDLWVNELRLVGVDDESGVAYRFDTQLKIADIGAVSFNYSRIDPSFHTLEQRFGSRQTSNSWGMNASMQLEKFFPSSWAGTSIPVSYSRSVNQGRPKYLPNSDILVEEAAEQRRERVLQGGGSQAEANAEATRIRQESETYRVSDTYAAPTIRIGLPSNEWYIRDTFNKLTLGFNYTKSAERSPSIVSKDTWQWNARISYAVSLPSDYFFQPFKGLFDGLWFLDEYKDFKLYFAPTNFSWALSSARSRDITRQRALQLGGQNTETISRAFTASRQLGFGWKLTEGGLLNLSGDYSVNVESSLLKFELDRFGRQRSFTSMLNKMFFGSKVLDFGDDLRYGQRNSFNTRPNIPNIFNIKKYLDVTFGYNVDYSWTNTISRGDIGKSASYNANVNTSMNIKLKQLFDPLFDERPSGAPQVPAPPPARGRGRDRSGDVDVRPDTAATADTVKAPSRGNIEHLLTQFKLLTKYLIKVPFLDYDNINITFTQTNNAQHSGVIGRTGFVNFWGRAPFQGSLPENGPSRLYQLGLITDPSGRLTNFGPRSYFPFFGWETERGPRALGGQLPQVYRQTNRITLKTNRALWEGARIDLNWNVGWSYSRNEQARTDSLNPIPVISSRTISGSIERSFMTFPDVLFLGMFKSSLKDVGKRYGELKALRDTSMTDAELLSQAFEEGFEALPIFSKIFGEYTPRVNWSLRWDGLERLSLFSGFVSRLSLDHAYASTYTKGFSNTGFGEQTDNQRVAYGFTPLVGLNFTFKELFKGNFGANLRYNTNTSFDLSPAARNLLETVSREISVTASYSRRGFEIPLFGLALNNDLDVSVSYSLTANSRRIYEATKLDINTTGQPQEGTTRTVFEPRIRYVLSLRVSASIYYRHTKLTPDASGSLIPGSTTNEAGLDLNISISP